MNTTKSQHAHTPGPWQVERNNPCRDTFVGPVMGGQRIAEIFNRVEGQGRTIANARLIAAAPAILSELEWLRETAHKYLYGTPEERDYYFKDLEHALGRAEEVIAQARGGGEPATPITPKSIAEAHDNLSELLEDSSADNSDIRDAAIRLCEALRNHFVE